MKKFILLSLPGISLFSYILYEVNPAIAKLSSPKDSTESNFSKDPSFTNKRDSWKRLGPISSKVLNTTEKEFFTIDIPENAEFVRIMASVTYLREESSIKSRIFQRLKYGDLFSGLKAIKGWMKVQALDSGEVGYVSKNLLN